MDLRSLLCLHHHSDLQMLIFDAMKLLWRIMISECCSYNVKTGQQSLEEENKGENKQKKKKITCIGMIIIYSTPQTASIEIWW